MGTEELAISQRLAVIIFAALIGSIITRIPYKRGFFTLPKQPAIDRVNGGWVRTFNAFAIFMAINLFLPAVLLAVLGKKTAAATATGATLDGDGSAIQTAPHEGTLQGWANILLILISFLAILIYYLLLDKKDRDQIWGKGTGDQRAAAPLRDFMVGAVSWFVIYPWTIVAGQIASIATSLLSNLPPQEQVAVKLIVELKDKPLLLGITVVSVFTIVPFLEELLFRGFMQSWLKNLFGVKKAILLTAAVFALFHFGVEQGISNVELLVSLFVLACFLGFLKEKRQSLWASIGLHSAFNLISLAMLLSLPG